MGKVWKTLKVMCVCSPDAQFQNSSPMILKIEETYNSPISQIYRICKWIHQFRK